MGKQDGLELMWTRIREIVGDFSRVSSPEAALDLADTVFRESRHWLELHSPDAPSPESVRRMDQIAFLWIPAYVRALDACASVEAHLQRYPDPTLESRNRAILEQAQALLEKHDRPGVRFENIRGVS